MRAKQNAGRLTRRYRTRRFRETQHRAVAVVAEKRSHRSRRAACRGWSVAFSHGIVRRKERGDEADRPAATSESQSADARRHVQRNGREGKARRER